MAEEVIRPEAEYLKLAMAEGNVVERLRGLIAKLIDEFEELYQSSNDLFQGRYEALKTRFERIRRHKKEFYELYQHSMFYLIRVGIGLQHRDAYTRIYLNLRAFSEELENLALYLVELAHSKTRIDESFVLGYQRFLEYLRDSLTTLVDSIQLLSINVNRAVEGFEKIIKLREVCDDIFKDLYLSLSSVSETLESVTLVTLRDLLRGTRESAYLLFRVAEDLRWIALHRT